MAQKGRGGGISPPSSERGGEIMLPNVVKVKSHVLLYSLPSQHCNYTFKIFIEAKFFFNSCILAF